MKNLRRIFIRLAVLAGCTLSLAGCHGSKGMEEFQIPEEFDTSRQFEVTFWAKNDTNKTQTDIYEKAISDFEAFYPNIKVNLRLYTDYGRIYNDVITNIATNTTPNVCITYPDHIATYLTGVNQVVPLESLFEDGKYGLGGSEVRFDSPTKDEIIPQFLEECAFDGHYYAVPYMRSTEALYINQTAVESMGYEVPDIVTWDYIWEVADACMEKDEEGKYKVNGQQVLIPFIYKSTDNMMIQYLRQCGAGYSTKDGEIQIFNDTTRAFLYTVAEHAGTGAFSTFKISSYPANFLNAGQCIFAVDSTAGATWMGTNATHSDISEEKIVDFRIAVRPVPQVDVTSPKMISQGPSVCVFNKEDPQEVMASWLFVQYLLTNDVQIAYSETEGYVPVTSKAQQSEEYRDYLSREGEDNDVHYAVKIRAAKLLLDNTDKTFVTPVFNGSASLRDAAGQMIENVTKSVRRKQTVDEKYMDQLYADMVSLYRLDQRNIRSGSAAEKKDMGPLPSTAVRLLGGLAMAWMLILAYVIRDYWKKKKRKAGNTTDKSV